MLMLRRRDVILSSQLSAVLIGGKDSKRIFETDLGSMTMSMIMMMMMMNEDRSTFMVVVVRWMTMLINENDAQLGN